MLDDATLILKPRDAGLAHVVFRVKYLNTTDKVSKPAAKLL